MKDFIFKAAVKLFGCFMTASGGILMYNHLISNFYVISIVFVTLVYFGVKLMNYDYR